jgi:hypothetical protein
MEDCNSVSTPAEPGLKLTKNMSPQSDKEKEEMEQIPYKESVGALLYISTTTRPDISYAVSQMAKFNQNPGIKHWKAESCEKDLSLPCRNQEVWNFFLPEQS